METGWRLSCEAARLIRATLTMRVTSIRPAILATTTRTTLTASRPIGMASISSESPTETHCKELPSQSFGRNNIAAMRFISYFDKA